MYEVRAIITAFGRSGELFMDGKRKRKRKGKGWVECFRLDTGRGKSGGGTGKRGGGKRGWGVAVELGWEMWG